MRPRKLKGHRYLSLAVVALLGAAVAGLPAIASSETPPTVNAVSAGSSGIYETFAWSPQQVAIAAGRSVTFANASATVEHGIVWSGSARPTCAASVPVGAERSGFSWSGGCTFAQAGKYDFYCSVHGPSMSGTVTVSPAGTTTTTAAQPGATTTTGTQTPAPAPTPALTAVALAAVQRGTSVHGSVHVAQAGSRLQIDLRTSAGLRIGRLVKHATAAGKVSFTVALSAKVKRALGNAKRVKLSVKLTVAPPAGKPASVTRHVTLKLHR